MPTMDDLEKALEAIPKEYSDEAIVLLAELKNANKSYGAGLLEPTELGKTKARLRAAVLKIIAR